MSSENMPVGVAAVALHRELLAFYWALGADIVERQVRHGWGSGSHDPDSAFAPSGLPMLIRQKLGGWGMSSEPTQKRLGLEE